MNWLRLISLMCAAALMPVPAQALPAGKQILEPIARNMRSGRRYAIILSPRKENNFADGQVESDAYTRRLRELGFTVITIGPSRRFDADAAVRDLANIPAASSVAIIVPAQAYADANDIFILTDDSSSTAINDPISLAGEALSLGFTLRTVRKSRPDQLVGLVLRCSRTGNSPTQCPADTAAGSSGASIISAYGAATGPSAAGIPPDKLLPLMTQEGLSFAALFNRLTGAMGGSGVTVNRSLDLSTDFMFTPLEFYQNIDTPCNSNRTGALSLTIARARVSACETAVATWPYAVDFVRARDMAAEQLAFAETDVPCGPSLRSASARYRAQYTSGAFISQVEQRFSDCDRRLADEARQRAAAERRDTYKQEPKANKQLSPSPVTRTPSGSGTWLIIMGSYAPADRSKALSKQDLLRGRGIEAQLVSTNKYPGLAPGLTIVSQGPYEKDTALRQLTAVKAIIPDAYIKSAY